MEIKLWMAESMVKRYERRLCLYEFYYKAEYNILHYMHRYICIELIYLENSKCNCL